jgi:ABC-type lipoprotein release transport system permease subunit
MSIIEAFRSALSAIAANALRSILTMLGIIIGVAAVIAMVAIGSGAREKVIGQIKSLGANLVIVQAGNVTAGGVRQGVGASSTLTDEDARAILAEVQGVTAAAPIIQGRAQAVFGGQNWSTSVTAVIFSSPANGSCRMAACLTPRNCAGARSWRCWARLSQNRCLARITRWAIQSVCAIRPFG